MSLNVIAGQLLKCVVVVLRAPERILENFSGGFFWGGGLLVFLSELPVVSVLVGRSK